jgi:hypothetical protein
MVRSLLLTIALLLGTGAVIAQSTVLQGKISDESGEGLIGATVKVLKGTDVVRGAITDFEGNYRLNLDPGTYDVEFSYTGFSTLRNSGVKVLNGQINFLDGTMSNTVLTEVVIKTFKVPLIKQDETATGQTLTSDQIKNLPTRSVNAIVATTAGTSSIDGGAVNIRGSRSNATNYYIDGIRVAGATPPVQDIEQLQVVTGGLGAEYGDVTGGVISVITKGPASEYHGAVEIENSNGLDPYGWLLGTANVSGPLIRRTKANGAKQTVLGFRLSGQYLRQRDDGPPASSVFVAKGTPLKYNTDGTIANWQEITDGTPLQYNADGTIANPEVITNNNVLGRIQALPLTPISGNIVPTAETLVGENVDALNYRPNEGRQDVDVTAKLDFRATENIDFSITGTLKDVRNQFTPGGWRLLNNNDNPTQYNQQYRGLFRLRHRLGGSDGAQDAASAKRVSISNASYTIQFGFDRSLGQSYDPRHGDRLFDYGYMGRFNFDFVPFGGPSDRGLIEQIDNQEAFRNFEAGYVNQNGQRIVTNPQLLQYNQFANDEFFFTYAAQNGRLLSVYDNLWADMHSNAGLVFNTFNKSQSDIITFMASTNFDVKLGRTGVHSIQLGIMNEQRNERSYGVSPFGLWLLGSQLANQHFNGIDYDQPTEKYWDATWSPIIGDSLQGFAVATVDLPEGKFYREVRNSLGLPLNEYVNVHSLRPDQLSLSMFSPRELTERNLIGYYGYDYLGNLTTDNITFNDFFSQRDENGYRTFPVAPLRPLYQGAYIKDKFTFNKMIFSLGMRVERFDLNTKVMRDQYSLYEVMSADQYHRTVPGAGVKPANIGDDYKVYVVGENDPSTKAYRNGDTWYFPDGRQANDGNVIFGGGVVAPLLLDTISGDDIFDARFNPNSAFEDYTPQVNFLPRLAFSFPISEDANFFAHYDVLVQRPPSNWQMTPLNYLYFYVPNRTPENNANLLPERVVDYEVGFQQRLNQNSALKFSAYYREMRDMIQSRTILFVPTIGRYNTFGNIDFGTTKGFTVQYDLRRVQNAELRLAYTLQFADGTGSNAISQRGLTTRGNLRTLYPLDFDERHNIQGIFDYRFDSGDRYNGPRIGGVDVLANFGANVQFLAVSGRPYTAKLRPTRFGGEGTIGAINGNRLPWRFNIDLRLDKSFALGAPGRRPLNLNVYFRVANILNRRNVINVYPYSGSPTDDGYLATAEGQSVIQGVVDQGRNPASYLASYSWVMLNPGNFTLPRRLYVGALFEF